MLHSRRRRRRDGALRCRWRGLVPDPQHAAPQQSYDSLKPRPYVPPTAAIQSTAAVSTTAIQSSSSSTAAAAAFTAATATESVPRLAFSPSPCTRYIIDF